jgi:predicted histone-like DNA-binding protein
MPIKYHAVPRQDPRDLTAPVKYYPSNVARGRTGLRELALKIGKLSTVSSADTLAVLEALLMVVPDELGRGQIVDLGELGSFRLTLEGRGEPSPGKVRGTSISGVRVHFHPGRLFREALAGIEYRKE